MATATSDFIDNTEPTVTTDTPENVNGNGNAHGNGHGNGGNTGNTLPIPTTTLQPAPTVQPAPAAQPTPATIESANPVPPENPEKTLLAPTVPPPVVNSKVPQDTPPKKNDNPGSSLVSHGTADNLNAGNPASSTGVVDSFNVVVTPSSSNDVSPTGVVRNSAITSGSGLNAGSSMGIVAGIVVGVCVIIGLVVRRYKQGKERGKRDLEGGNAMNRDFMDSASSYSGNSGGNKAYAFNDHSSLTPPLPSYGGDYVDGRSPPVSPVPMLFAIPNAEGYYASAFSNQQHQQENSDSRGEVVIIEDEAGRKSIDYDKYRSVYSEASVNITSLNSNENQSAADITEQTYNHFMTTPVVEDPRNFSLISDFSTGSEFSSVKEMDVYEDNSRQYYPSIYSEASSVEVIVPIEEENDKPLPSKPASASLSNKFSASEISNAKKSSPLRNTLIFQDSDNESDDEYQAERTESVVINSYGKNEELRYSVDTVESSQASDNRDSWMTNGSADMEFDGGLTK